MDLAFEFLYLEKTFMRAFILFLFIGCLHFSIDCQVVIRQGKYSSGDALYNWDGKVLRQGKYSSGDAICNFDGKVIRQGKYSSGDALYNFDGKVLRQGKYSSGDAIINVEGKVPTAILIFIAL